MFKVIKEIENGVESLTAIFVDESPQALALHSLYKGYKGNTGDKISLQNSNEGPFIDLSKDGKNFKITIKEV